MKNWLYTFEWGGTVDTQNRKYKLGMIVHWSDRTEKAKEVEKRYYYFIGQLSDIEKYFSSEAVVEDFFNTYPQNSKFNVREVVEMKLI